MKSIFNKGLMLAMGIVATAVIAFSFSASALDNPAKKTQGAACCSDSTCCKGMPCCKDGKCEMCSDGKCATGKCCKDGKCAMKAGRPGMKCKMKGGHGMMDGMKCDSTKMKDCCKGMKHNRRMDSTQIKPLLPGDKAPMIH